MEKKFSSTTPYIVVDIESTGLKTPFHSPQPIEIAASLYDPTQNKVISKFHTLIKPEVRIQPGAARVHKITESMLQNAPGVSEGLQKFFEFAGENPLVGHNIGFDFDILQREAKQRGINVGTKELIDTLPIARELEPNLPQHTLDFLSSIYGIAPPTHRAAADVESTIGLISKLSKGEGLHSISSNKAIRSISSRITEQGAQKEGKGIGGLIAQTIAEGWTPRNIGILGGVAGTIAGGLLAYKHFSGKDDEYNTIPGLAHGGFAQKMRRQLTDFGSGYQGLNTERQDEDRNKKGFLDYLYQGVKGVHWGVRGVTFGATIASFGKRTQEEVLTKYLGEHGPKLNKLPAPLWYTEQAISILKAQQGEERKQAIGKTAISIVGWEAATAAMDKWLFPKLDPLLKKFPHTGLKFGIRHYGSLGAAIGLANIVFPNKDISDRESRDKRFHKIEGLSSGGMAEQLRKENTEFGSPWKGQKKKEKKDNKNLNTLLATYIGTNSIAMGAYHLSPDKKWINAPETQEELFQQVLKTDIRPGDVIFSRNTVYTDPFHSAIVGDDGFIYDAYPGNRMRPGGAELNRKSLSSYIGDQFASHPKEGMPYPIYGIARDSRLTAEESLKVATEARLLWKAYEEGAINPLYGFKANQGVNQFNCLSLTAKAYKEVGKEFFHEGTNLALSWNVDLSHANWVYKGPVPNPKTFKRLSGALGIGGIGLGIATLDPGLIAYGTAMMGLSHFGANLEEQVGKAAVATILSPNFVKKHARSFISTSLYSTLAYPLVSKGIDLFQNTKKEEIKSKKEIQRVERHKSTNLAMGVITGLATYSTLYPWKINEIDLTKYPRLAALQKAAKEGIRTLSAEGLTEESVKDLSFMTKEKSAFFFSYGTLRPVEKKNLGSFSGLVYIQSGEYSNLPEGKTYANLGNWNIGVDKVETWEYLNKKGVSDIHAPSVTGSDFYIREQGKIKGLSEKAKEFIERHKGLENLVLKHRKAARGEGVWIGLDKVPGDIAERFARNPEEYLVQAKLNLAEEFRVVTVGDKAISATYRYGSPEVRKLAVKLGFESVAEKTTNKVGRVSPFEVIQPYFGEQRQGLLDFAEKASRELPYEIGALDIGLTKEGKFFVIEAQRQFGNISNPMISSRMKEILTKKMSPYSMAVVGIAGIVGVKGLGSLFGSESSEKKEKLTKPVNKISGKDDDYNTIEGLNEKGLAAKLRKQNTDFGSGYQGQLTQKDQETVRFITQLLSIGAFVHGGYGVFKGIQKYGGAKQYFSGLMEGLKTRDSEKMLGLLEVGETAIGGLEVVSILHNWIFKKSNQKIPKENRSINPIEGMSEKGIGSKLRKKNTVFGSKHDRLKLFLELIENTTLGAKQANKNFLEVLKSGKVIKKLGEGGQGTAHLMEISIPGMDEPFRYVRKTPIKSRSTIAKEIKEVRKYARENPLGSWTVEGNEGIGKLTSREFALTQLPSNEASILKQFGEESEVIPNLYGFNKETNEIFMEAMPGETLSTLLGKATQGSVDIDLNLIKEKMTDQILSFSQQGVRNVDIKPGNMLYDTKTKRVSWIDQGYAVQTKGWISKKYTEMEQIAEKRVYRPFKMAVPTPEMPTQQVLGVPVISDEANKQADELRKAIQQKRQAEKLIIQKQTIVARKLKQDQAIVATAGINGGNRHQRMTTSKNIR